MAGQHEEIFCLCLFFSGVFVNFFFLRLLPSVLIYFLSLFSPLVHPFFHLYHSLSSLCARISLKLHIRLFNFFCTVFSSKHSQIPKTPKSVSLHSHSFSLGSVPNHTYFSYLHYSKSIQLFFLLPFFFSLYPSFFLFSKPFHSIDNFFFTVNSTLLAFYSFVSYYS